MKTVFFNNVVTHWWKVFLPGEKYQLNDNDYKYLSKYTTASVTQSVSVSSDDTTKKKKKKNCKNC